MFNRDEHFVIDFEMANVCGVTFQNNDVHIQNLDS